MTNELNTTNIVDAETADIFFAALLDSMEDNKNQLTEDVTELHNIEAYAKKEYKKDKNSQASKNADILLCNKKIAFLNTYGKEKLTQFVMYSTLESRIDFVVKEKGVLRRFKNNKRNADTKEY